MTSLYDDIEEEKRWQARQETLINDGVECPECHHESLFFTMRLKATLIDPVAEAGFCICISAAGDPPKDSPLRVKHEREIKYARCRCNYEFG